MRKALTILKVLLLLAIVAVYNVYLVAFEPIFTTDLALQQMQNYDTSSSGIMAYTYVRNYGWFVILALAVVLFAGDAVKIIKSMKEKKKHEEKI